MNKFDIEYKKIIEKQNLISQEIIEQISVDSIKQGFSKAWQSITGIGKSISDAIDKGIKWGEKKICAALQKLFDQLNPDTAKTVVEKTKSLIKVMPDFMVKNAKQAVKISQSDEIKHYMHGEVVKQYKSIQNFQQLTAEKKKEFIRTKTDEYLKEKNIISQQAITLTAGAAMLFLLIKGIIILIVAGTILIGGSMWLVHIGKETGLIKKTKDQEAQQQLDADRITRENEIEAEKFAQWKSDQQRQKIFKQIINVAQFQ